MIMSLLSSPQYLWRQEILLAVHRKESYLTLFTPVLTSCGAVLLNELLIRWSYKSSNVPTSWPTCKSTSSRFQDFYFLGIVLCSQVLNYTTQDSLMASPSRSYRSSWYLWGFQFKPQTGVYLGGWGWGRNFTKISLWPSSWKREHKFTGIHLRHTHFWG